MNAGSGIVDERTFHHFGPRCRGVLDPDPSDLGGKGAGLVRMAAIGLPVPDGFVIPISARTDLLGPDGAIHDKGREALSRAVRLLEERTGRRFGGARRPLLLAVRSGSALSMPGMMETVLDLGLNEFSVRGLIRLSGNARMAWDSYRRLVLSYAEGVLGVTSTSFEADLRALLAETGAASPREFDSEEAERLARATLFRFRRLTGQEFPIDPFEQLEKAVAAVFRSWNLPRAREYRRIQGLGQGGGTAVTVQMMVFGNAGSASGSGVCFSRDPATGDRKPLVDFVFNGQGEDVVAGRGLIDSGDVLALRLPSVHQQVLALASRLEDEFRDLQDFEFTVESGRLYLLQSRAGKRSPWAAVRVAVDMVDEGRIRVAEALGRLAPIDLDQVRRRVLVEEAGTEVLAEAETAGPGLACGLVVLDSDEAERRASEGERVILVRNDCSPDDVAAMAVSEGILTRQGSRTSHAAVVARQLGKVCLVGCRDLVIDPAGAGIRLGDIALDRGSEIGLDGDGGRVVRGSMECRIERPEAALARIRSWRADPAVEAEG